MVFLLSPWLFRNDFPYGIVWIARSGVPWRDLPERYGSWQTVYSRFRKWIEDGTLDNIFRVLSLEAELTELSIDDSIVKAHQHSAGAKKKGGLQTKSDTAVLEPCKTPPFKYNNLKHSVSVNALSLFFVSHWLSCIFFAIVRH